MNDIRIEIKKSSTNISKNDRLIVGAWKGEIPLWKAFWINYVFIGTIFSRSIEQLILPTGNQYLMTMGLIINIGVIVWTSVSVWRCAYNVKYRIMGHIARGGIAIVTIVLISTLIMA